MRRLIALLSVIALLAALPATAVARPPTKSTNQVQDAGCSGFVTPYGILELYGYVDALFGSDAFLDLWSDEQELLLARDGDLPPTVTFAGDSVSMLIPVVSTGIDPSLTAGTVALSATRTEVGPISFDDRFREGNRWFRFSGEGTLYALSGTVTLPGVSEPIELDPAACQSADTVQTEFITNPNATRQSFQISAGGCEATNADGDTAQLFIDRFEGGVFVDGTVTDASGAEVGFVGEDALGPDGSATLELTEYDVETFEPVGTTGSASLTLVDSGEVVTYTLRTSNGFERVRASIVDVEGSLSTSLGSFSLDGCLIATGEVKQVTTPSSGPKPGGRRPANDLPGGAIALGPGGRATVSTRGAQRPSEAEYPCLTFTDPFDGATYVFEAEHTVWYTVAGTGGEITVDTAGSDFDTVIAVYEGSPDGVVVACVDDTPLDPIGRTLQGQATFATTPGTTYWVQIGGLNEEPAFGPDPFVSYGNLKVAVRAS